MNRWREIMSRRKIATAFRHALGLMCLGALLAPPAWAGVNPQPFRTGLFGITPGQAIRVSVLNAGNEGGTVNPCFNPALAGFVVKLSSPAGRVLFEAPHKALPEGRGAFTDFIQPPPEDGVTRNRRAQVRADVAVELQPIPDDGRCTDDAVARRHARRLLRNVHLTLEVFDVATGQTAFTIPFSEVMFNPQPEPPEP
jgi:hypothetical protein